MAHRDLLSRRRCNLAARLCAEAKDGQILVSAASPERSKR
jgi:class 3 adenylate cyclase